MNTALFAAVDAPAWLMHLRKLSPEEVLFPVLVQLSVIILVARIFAMLFRKIGQPSVVGEIAAGIVLGPSILGWLFPELSQAIFHPGLPGIDTELADATLNWILTALSDIGLIFLLFLIGLEFDFGHLRLNGKSAVAISVSGILLPFGLGLALAPILLPHLESEVPHLGFALFLGTALSITAIPILGRIMVELNITRTRLGAITISAAAIGDAVGWILLAAVAAIVRGNFEVTSTLLMVAQTVGFTLFIGLLARPVLRWWSNKALRRGDGELGINDLAILITVLFACAIVTNKIGIFAIFGAFLLGAALSSEHEFRLAVTRRLRDFVTVFFLPIFFTFTGLRTNINALETPHLWMLCGLVLATAMLGKLGGCGLAARLTGFSWRESACIGTMMNARGLMELIVVNVGYELGVIPQNIFCMLVIMALFTTVMTTPIVLRLMWGTELEPHILQSSFFAKRPPVASSAEPASKLERIES